MLTFGDLRLNESDGRLDCGGQSVIVSPAINRLLALLMAAGGDLRTTDMIKEQLRKSERYPPISADNMRARLYELRNTLAAIGSRTYIVNQFGYGYRVSFNVERRST